MAKRSKARFDKALPPLDMLNIELELEDVSLELTLEELNLEDVDLELQLAEFSEASVRRIYAEFNVC